MTPANEARVSWLRLVALVGGPAVALALHRLLPTTYVDASGIEQTFNPAGRATLAAMAWMGIWWLTEAVDISATALLPVAVFPVLGIATMKDAAAPYANDLIFLFLGGFMLAGAMQRWSLDRRIALTCLRFTGTTAAGMVGGFMLVTAGLSMWVSNTATAAMMLPIASSVITLAAKCSDEIDHDSPHRSRFALCLLLGIAYAASIGGIGTLIGSPPNGIAAEFIRGSLGREVGFADWMLVGVPFVVVILPLTWILLVFVLYRPEIRRIEGGDELVRGELVALGPLKRGELVTLCVFVATAALWITRPWLARLTLGGHAPFAMLTDGGIAILAALALFVVPVGVRPLRPTLDWPTAQRLPWGVLILFGGGLSLASAVKSNGVAEFIGAQTAVLHGVPPLATVLAVTTLIVFLTELTSNTATTATMVPLLAALSPGLGVDPYLLIIPATIGASCAFMMPVATPPNAMVFATGHITIPQMAKAGFVLNLLSILVITALAYGVVVPLFVRS
ncbi:MAG: DASS family sodium-coupled anion symporter [Phycisphaerales bacterium]|nr:DASS family sodium-coupled anion symporter [Phycisphaerales bacterium]